jgi:hypothetical protein
MEQICDKDIKELKNQKVLLGKDFQLTNFN